MIFTYKQTTDFKQRNLAEFKIIFDVLLHIGRFVRQKRLDFSIAKLFEVLLKARVAFDILGEVDDCFDLYIFRAKNEAPLRK